MAAAEDERPLDFIREIVRDDLAAGRHRARRHPLPARAERLPPHRARQGDLPRLLARRASTAAAATCASTTPTRPPRRPSSSSRSRPTCAGSASTGARISTSPRTTSRSSTATRCELIRRGRPSSASSPPRRSSAHRGTLTEPGRAEPVARAHRRREPRAVRAHARRASSRRAATCCARRSTWPRRCCRCATRSSTGSWTPPHHRTGRTLADLPDVRLRALPVGRDRGHHALALHARVRRPPRRSTTGSSRRSTCRSRARARSSSRAATSRTP